MEKIDFKKELLGYIEEGKTKPALVAAKLTLRAENDEQYFKKFYTLAIDWINLLAELDHPNVEFNDVYRLVITTDITQEFHERVRLSNYLHQLRTETFCDDNLEEILSDLQPLQDIKSLVCKIFGCMYLENISDSYKHLHEAIDMDASLTRSMLLCFEVPVLEELKNRFGKAREKGTIPCSCNTGFQNFGFTHSIIHAVKAYSSSEKIAETSFISDVFSSNNSQQICKNNAMLTVCNLHRTISDLNDILYTLKSHDVTAVLNAHIEAGRYEHALLYMVKHKNNINEREVRNLEKLMAINNHQSSWLEVI